MKLWRLALRWLRRPNAERTADLRAGIEAALADRAARRPALQARARKGASTRIHNRFTGDRLVGAGSATEGSDDDGR